MIMTAQVLCDPSARGRADPGADGLDRCKKGKAERDGPCERIAELRTDLTVRRNAARIVVGSASDKARAKLRDEARC